MNHLFPFSRRIILCTFGLGVAIAGAYGFSQKSALSSPPSGNVTPWAAMHTAATKSGGTAFKAIFEFEDGHWQYAVLVLKGKKISEVEINASTGAVGDVEGVDPNGEANELKSELQAMIKAGGK